MKRWFCISAALAAILWVGHGSQAAQRIAILDFELNDISSLPNTVTERQRTASMAPLLADALRREGDYQIVSVNADVMKSANAGFGYLFRYQDAAAQLGRELGADWVLVSQHSKLSFLVSYMITQLIRVKNPALITRYDIELKGNHHKVTEHAVDRLAGSIRKTLGR